MRKFGVPPAVPLFTVKELAPVPEMVMSLARFGKAVAKLIVQTPPLHPGSPPAKLKLIVFGSLEELAALIASRRVQPFPVPSAVHEPSSASTVVFTVSVGSASVQSEKEDTPFSVAKWLDVLSVLGANCVKLPSYLKI